MHGIHVLKSLVIIERMKSLKFASKCITVQFVVSNKAALEHIASAAHSKVHLNRFPHKSLVRIITTG